MTTEEKAELFKSMFQGANLQNAQINVVVEAGAEVCYNKTVSQSASAARFPNCGSENEGRQWFDFVKREGFIDPLTQPDNWLYQMGYSENKPAKVKPIVWLKTVETARLMLYRIYEPLLNAKQLTVKQMSDFASLCFIKKGKPLRLAKPKPESSQDADKIADFVPTCSDL